MKILKRLRESSDPSIRYRCRRLLDGEDTAAKEMKKLRSRIAGSENARRLLSHRLSDGTISGGPYRKWQGPHWTLYSLYLIDYPPGDRSLKPLGEQVYRWLFSEKHLNPPSTLVISGQEDRPRRCVSQEGYAVIYSMELGLEDERTEILVDRLIDFQWPDGGWNCDRRPGARKSSFVETLIPLQALFRYGRKYSHSRARTAAARAAGYLLSNELLFRRRDGRLVKPSWGGDIDKIHFPIRFYDLLYALMVMAEMGKIRDKRCRKALDLLRSKQVPDGGFPLELRNARYSDTVRSRGSFADWGRGGKTRSNPFISIDALWVLKEAGMMNF